MSRIDRSQNSLELKNWIKANQSFIMLFVHDLLHLQYSIKQFCLTIRHNVFTGIAYSKRLRLRSMNDYSVLKSRAEVNETKFNDLSEHS